MISGKGMDVEGKMYGMKIARGVKVVWEKKAVQGKGVVWKMEVE